MLMCSLAVVHVQGGAGQSCPLSWPLNSKKMEGGKMAHPHACCDGMWVAMRKNMGTGKGKEEGKKGQKKKKRGRKKWVMTQWHQQSPVPTLKLPPSPPPLLAKLCPSPWAGHNLARRGGRGGGEGMVVVFIFKKKLNKNSLSKNGQSFPLSWPLNSKKRRVARWHTHMHAVMGCGWQ